MKRHLWLLAVVLGLALPAGSFAGGTVLEEMFAAYRAEGAGPFDAKRGEAFWHKEYPAPEGAEGPARRSCATCHGADLTKPGKHYRTGKVIDPMAPSVNPERFTDAKKIRKWFRRNCKWVLGRACTAQEKGDVLAYLKNL